MKLGINILPIISRIVRKGKFSKSMFIIDYAEVEEYEKELKKQKIKKEDLEEKLKTKRNEIQQGFGIDLGIKLLSQEEFFHDDLIELLSKVTKKSIEEIENMELKEVIGIVKDLMSNREFFSAFFS